MLEEVANSGDSLPHTALLFCQFFHSILLFSFSLFSIKYRPQALSLAIAEK